MEEETVVERLPDKSRSLRRTSVKKRLQTEINKKKVKVKDNFPKKRKLSKYRRKAANAKERERMKNMNDVFATLKSVVPDYNKDPPEEGKETKVETLRSAISYINYLKQLIEDCDAGLVDEKAVEGKDVENYEANGKVDMNRKQLKKAKTLKKSSKPMKSEVKSCKPIILDTKGTNYSPQFLEHKFSISKSKDLLESRDDYQIEASHQNTVHHTLPDITIFNQPNYYTSPSSSSPIDVNEISLHISLLEKKDQIESNIHEKESLLEKVNTFEVHLIKENWDSLWQQQISKFVYEQ